jgi:hypothetical protein
VWMMENCINNGSGLGINCYSNHWDFMARLLLSISNMLFAGDFRHFDGSMFLRLLLRIGDYISDWFDDGPEMKRARRVIFMEVWHSFHASGEHIFEWLARLPSGHPLTTIINLIVVQVLIRMSYAKIMGNLLDFHQKVVVVSYGDDNVGSIHSSIIDRFNQITIADAMKDFGFEYTDENKSETMQPFRSIQEVSFLKRGFRYENVLRKFVAPLELDTILEIPMWTKSGSRSLTIAKDNVDCCLRELAIHPENIFNHWAPKVVEASQKFLGYTPYVTDWYTLLEESCHRIEFW